VTNKNTIAFEQRKCCGRGNNWADNLLCRKHSRQSLYVAGIADQLPEWSIFFDTSRVFVKKCFFVGMSGLYVRTPEQSAKVCQCSLSSHLNFKIW